MPDVVAPSRLHFGLLRVPAEGDADEPGLPVRHFGGVGLMVERPGVAVSVEPADAWSARGPLAGRALGFARTVSDGFPAEVRRPLVVRVERCPPEHAGLGVGTQLALAVARGVTSAYGAGDLPAEELARRTGRGGRSAVGVHGFARGGLIVEAGKRHPGGVSPLLARYEFPPEWGVVLLVPKRAGPWHGGREREAFARLRADPDSPARSDRMLRLLFAGLIPALLERDLATFSEALYEYNREAGAMFARAQGGIYVSAEVGRVVVELRSAGIAGVGQSSWGPTVFAVTDAAGERAVSERIEASGMGRQWSVIRTAASRGQITFS